MEGDLFGDLLGSKPATSGGGARNGPLLPGESSLTGQSSLKQSEHASAGAPIPADAFKSSDSRAEADSPSSSRKETISKEDLQLVLAATVQSAVEAALGKFAKSLRTVLEDLGKRIDNSNNLTVELRESMELLKDVVDAQSENFHARFTSLDMAVGSLSSSFQPTTKPYRPCTLPQAHPLRLNITLRNAPA